MIWFLYCILACFLALGYMYIREVLMNTKKGGTK